MISLDISHIYGALFIDLPKVSDTVDRTFLLQQFTRDTDFTVAWFSSNIIGHWVLWGSWHRNSSAVSVLQRKDAPSPQIVGLVSFPGMAYSLTTTCMIPLKSLRQTLSLTFFDRTCPQLAAWTDKGTTTILNTLSAPLTLSNLRSRRPPA